MTSLAMRIDIVGRSIAVGVTLTVFAAAVGSATPARAQTHESYGVFCAGGRITVDSRSEEQMRSQRGACQFSRFPNRSDAEGFARRNFGGIGGTCSCR